MCGRHRIPTRIRSRTGPRVPDREHHRSPEDHADVPRDARPFAVTLACGFTPLHLQTFLAAHLQQSLPDRKVTITSGLYGNLAGTLEAIRNRRCPTAWLLPWSGPTWTPASTTAAPAVGVAQPRATSLAARKLCSRASAPRWREFLPDRASRCRCRRCRCRRCFTRRDGRPPHTSCSCESDLLHFAADIAQDGRVAIVKQQRLAEASPAGARLDLKSDLYTGLPYTMQHADRLAAQLAQTLLPPAPKKGIISDLDDTLWSGIVGEVGPDAVTWDLASHAQLHGLYQKLLGSLADSGTLIGVASKNDPAVVHQAFERPDLLLRPDQVFPIEVHWNAKSGSVARILETWNIAADSVIFVDDSPMELAEVAAAHPGIECVLFPKNDYAAWPGDAAPPARSLRQGARFAGRRAAAGEHSSGRRISRAGLRRRRARKLPAADQRRRDFRLRRRRRAARLGTGEQDEPVQPERPPLHRSRLAKLLAATRRGAGRRSAMKISLGRWVRLRCWRDASRASRLNVEAWVMSCRAFARRIEHQTLKTLFDATGASEIEFDFAPTAKNGATARIFREPAGRASRSPSSA